MHFLMRVKPKLSSLILKNYQFVLIRLIYFLEQAQILYKFIVKVNEIDKQIK